jgi:hypothetical protein
VDAIDPDTLRDLEIGVISDFAFMVLSITPKRSKTALMSSQQG